MVVGSAWLVMVLVGCSGGEDGGGAPSVETIHPLTEAQEDAWEQTVWWTGETGERVVGTAVRETAGGVQILLGVVGSDGQRRTLGSMGPGTAEVVENRFVPEEDADDTVATHEGGGRRVLIDDGEVEVLTLVDTKGGGRTVLVQDEPDVRLRMPTFSPSGDAVYVASTGAGRRGLFRAALPEVDLTRVVPDADAQFPEAFDADGVPHVAFVTGREGVPPRLVVARPVDAEVRPAAALLEEGLPEVWVQVVLDAQGDAWALQGCTPSEPLRLDPQPGGTTVRLSAASIPAEEVRSCGEDCWVFRQRSSAGAPVVLARVSPGSHGTSRWAFENGDAGTWLPNLADEAGEGASVRKVPACSPALDRGRWLRQPEQTLPPGVELLRIGDADGVLRTGILDGRQPWFVLGPDRGPTRRQSVHKPAPRFEPLDRSEDGTVEVRVDGGALIWERRGEEPAVVLDAAEGQTITALSLGDEGSAVYVGMEGERPGVYRIDLVEGEMTAVAGVARPLDVHALSRDGAWGVAWGEPQPDGSTLVVSAWPSDDALLAVWALGARTLVDTVGRWDPVAEVDGRRVRCEDRPAVEVALTEEGPRLAWGDIAVPLVTRWPASEGGDHFLTAASDGTPTAIATRYDAEGGTSVWVPRGLPGVRSRGAWMPATAAAALDVEACGR